MATGSRSDCLHGRSRLRLIVFILFYGFAQRAFLIGRGYGVLGFSSVIYILWPLDKSSLMMVLPAIYNRFRQ